MKKMRLFAACALALAIAGMAAASNPGNVLWYQHPSRMPAVQTIGSGGTISVDACGGVKRICAASAVTTSTSHTFDAPSANFAGCRMDVVNVCGNAITLDNNSEFKSAGAADVVLGAFDSAIVVGTVDSAKINPQWVQLAGTGNN